VLSGGAAAGGLLAAGAPIVGVLVVASVIGGVQLVLAKLTMRPWDGREGGQVYAGAAFAAVGGLATAVGFLIRAMS